MAIGTGLIRAHYCASVNAVDGRIVPPTQAQHEAAHADFDEWLDAQIQAATKPLREELEHERFKYRQVLQAASSGLEHGEPDPLDDAVAAAVAARAAWREMEWREGQEREVNWQRDVLPLQFAAEHAEKNAIMGLQMEIARRAQEIEQARLATVPEQSEWHIYVHGVKTPNQYETCDGCNYNTHTCPGCGEWLYHGKGVCGPCGEEE